MPFDFRKFPRVLAAGLLAMCLAMSAAQADDDVDDDDEGLAFPIVSNTKWKTECGSCHIAFPPRLLPAESWRTIMPGLDKHFGSDASLDAATNREITAFLEKYAGRRGYDSLSKPQLRITETHWFSSEHHKVASRVWSNPKVKSRANCAACHTQAENGRFSEHDIRIPR
jgi:hypothetical protein